MKNTVERIYVEAVENAMVHIKMADSQKQVNAITKREYKKVNQLILVAANKFESNEWYTIEQIKESGLTIKEDEKGTQLFSFKINTSTKEVEGESVEKKVKNYRYYFVFNKSQLEERKA